MSGTARELGEQARLMRRILALEAERVLGVASLGRIDGVGPMDLARVEARLDALIAELQADGRPYPGRLLAERHGLDGLAYGLLQVALLPFHDPEAASSLVALLGDPEAGSMRLSHMMQLAQPDGGDLARLRGALLGSPAVVAGLVVFAPEGAVDPALWPHPVVLARFGLAPPPEAGAAGDDGDGGDAGPTR